MIKTNITIINIKFREYITNNNDTYGYILSAKLEKIGVITSFSSLVLFSGLFISIISLDIKSFVILSIINKKKILYFFNNSHFKYFTN